MFSQVKEIPFTVGNSYLMYVDVILNHKISRQFIFDTGASGIVINSELFNHMLKSNLISNNDITGSVIATLADGSQVKAKAVKLISVKLNDVELNNLDAMVMPDINAPLLIGQNVFSRFGKITIDNSSQKILFEGRNNTPNAGNTALNELRIIPCSNDLTYMCNKIESHIKNSVSVNTFSEETNVPPPQRAVDRVGSFITIRYFDSSTYSYALIIKNLLMNQWNDVHIEDMRPYYSTPIPDYIEIWIKN